MPDHYIHYIGMLMFHFLTIQIYPVVKILIYPRSWSHFLVISYNLVPNLGFAHAARQALELT